MEQQFKNFQRAKRLVRCLRRTYEESGVLKNGVLWLFKFSLRFKAVCLDDNTHSVSSKLHRPSDQGHENFAWTFDPQVYLMVSFKIQMQNYNADRRLADHIYTQRMIYWIFAHMKYHAKGFSSRGVYDDNICHGFIDGPAQALLKSHKWFSNARNLSSIYV